MQDAPRTVYGKHNLEKYRSSPIVKPAHALVSISPTRIQLSCNDSQCPQLCLHRFPSQITTLTRNCSCRSDHRPFCGSMMSYMSLIEFSQPNAKAPLLEVSPIYPCKTNLDSHVASTWHPSGLIKLRTKAQYRLASQSTMKTLN